MPQAQQYERGYDFTGRDGDDTNHAKINEELDAAALSIDQLRTNAALIQRDDGALANNSVGPEQLTPEAFTALQASVDANVQLAVDSAQSALTSAVTAVQAAADASAAIDTVNTAQQASLLNAQAAQASAVASGASATTAATQAGNAATQAGIATTKAGEATTKAAESAASASASNAAYVALTTNADVLAVAENMADVQAVADAIPELVTKVTKDSDTGAAFIPAGTTAQRPVAPADGRTRYNKTLRTLEVYDAVGAIWKPAGQGASGAVGNPVFYENDKVVTGDYTIPGNKNAISAGPIEIADGVTVTVADGATWTIV